PRLEPLEIVAKGAPVLRHAEMRRVRRGFLDQTVVDRRDRRALTRYLRVHTLQDLAGREAVYQHVELRLAQQIDEARCDDEVGGIDGRGGRRATERADGGDAVADEADVTAEPGRSRAVDDPPVG